MDGIKDFFECFSPGNFYDTDNNKKINFPQGSPYNEEDWKFYKKLRDTKPQTDPKRLPRLFLAMTEFTEPGIGIVILPETHFMYSSSNA